MRSQHASNRYPYYRCEHGVAKRVNKERCDARKGIRADHLDDAVWAQIERLLREPGALEAEVARVVAAEIGSVDDLAAEVNEVEAQLQGLHQKTARLVDAVANGTLPMDAVKKKQEALGAAGKPLKRRLDLLRIQLNRAAAKGVRLAVVETRVAEIRDSLSDLTVEARQEVARELLNAVHVDTMTQEATIKALVLLDADDEPNGGGGGADNSSFYQRNQSTSTSYGTQSSAT